MSDPLKLMALDEEDLTVISAFVQDAVLKGEELVYDTASQTLALPLNRFAWESKGARRWFFKKYERRSAVLHFAQVKGVRSHGIDRNGQDVLSLLAIEFAADDAPSGTLYLSFSGDAAMEIDVACIEAKLTDLGAAWTARGKPRHVT